MFTISESSATRPSFFELWAEGQLIAGLRPAVQYIFGVLSQRDWRWDWYARHADELFFALLLLFETHYLRHYDGSFAENFYSLRRVRVVNAAPARSAGARGGATAATATAATAAAAAAAGSAAAPSIELRTRDRLLSLLTLVVLPYVKVKLDERFVEMSQAQGRALERDSFDTAGGGGGGGGGGEHDDATFDRPLNIVLPAELLATHTTGGNDGDAAAAAASTRTTAATWRARARRAFVRFYPSVHAAYTALHFVYQLLFMHSRTRYFSPLLHALGLEVRRLQPADIASQAARIASSRRRTLAAHPSTSMFDTLARALLRGAFVFTDYAPYALPLAVFAFRFAEWWHAETSKSTQVLPIPAPPPRVERPPHSLAATPSSDCPLCRRRRTNPAMLAVSGFVFCYPCVAEYVAANARCPVTGLPAAADTIRRIYDDA